jgi:hypothetical protein
MGQIGPEAHGRKHHARPVPAGAVVHAPRVVTARTAHTVARSTSSCQWPEGGEVFW